MIIMIQDFMGKFTYCLTHPFLYFFSRMSNHKAMRVFFVCVYLRRKLSWIYTRWWNFTLEVLADCWTSEQLPLQQLLVYTTTTSWSAQFEFMFGPNINSPSSNKKYLYYLLPTYFTPAIILTQKVTNNKYDVNR